MNLFVEPVVLLKRNFYWGIFQGFKGKTKHGAFSEETQIWKIRIFWNELTEK